ncbi:serine hydrolase domain-containing protein [Rubripirellula reticaptiva]|uniref:D-alanyl-D-alanine carboxypeptidase n=1 Tax=Rubripirellula reticaptiva TaxID=2528013 RepID=A0A5C6FBW8_9BACT|nr:serine hydrolase domain-containing protein [Rubripirellula reticaptiva]TWU57121.1 D-alanyl-D-alanine carboxypeptidase precursor [Rubripirellula reticaptiva]
MKRRIFLGSGLALAICPRAGAGMDESRLESACRILANAAEQGEIQASAIYVQQGSDVFSRTYGLARDTDAMFLLASISKTISIAAVMKLFDDGRFELDDRVQRYLPEFQGDGCEKITIRQLMTHVSGLPDQLPENARLRASHASLAEFVAAAVKTPLLFEPGSRYSYSSMAILLATEVARRISGRSIADLTHERIFKPLRMTRSAMGLGAFKISDVLMNQVDWAAPESGAGDPSTKSWDWNSPYWRKLGAPWGTAHGSAEDVARFLREFLHSTGRILKPETIKLIISNQNSPNIQPRGLGFDLGQIGNTPHLSDETFGHTGSTGTICWADPSTDSICVILTTLPYGAVFPHPRDLVATRIAEALQKS